MQRGELPAVMSGGLGELREHLCGSADESDVLRGYGGLRRGWHWWRWDHLSGRTDLQWWNVPAFVSIGARRMRRRLYRSAEQSRKLRRHCRLWHCRNRRRGRDLFDGAGMQWRQLSAFLSIDPGKLWRHLCRSADQPPLLRGVRRVRLGGRGHGWHELRGGRDLQQRHVPAFLPSATRRMQQPMH